MLFLQGHNSYALSKSILCRFTSYSVLLKNVKNCKKSFPQSNSCYFSSRKENAPKMRSDSAGLPDFIEHWNPKLFRQVGYGLSGMTIGSVLLQYWELASIFFVTQGLYWYVGLNDMKQSDLVIKRNFPVLGNVRYILEVIRPEIRQYFIEGDHDKLPFSRVQRHIVYNRSIGNDSSIMPFGTKFNTDQVGYEWCNHSLYPTKLNVDDQRVIIGKNNPDSTKQPYSSSLYNISAMSYGALSDRAIQSLSMGANLGKFSHNTGEGGISEFHKQGNADLVWNIGTAYFGCGKFDDSGKVRIFDDELFKKNATYAKMIEIKLSQGAKPAHGGMLPKEKVSKSIADARNLPYPMTVDCNSPPCHTAFSNPNELCDFIAKLKRLSDGKPIGIKLCVGQPEEFSALVHAFLKSGVHPDFITIDGAEGGTGAAPVEFSNFVGTPLFSALSFVHAILVGTGYRDPNDKSKSKIALIASGKIVSGDDMYKTFALGADICNAARPFLFSLGCIQALKCHTNKCPTGITTQKPELTWGLDPASKHVRVANFQRATVKACVELMEATGVPSWAHIKPHHVVRRVDTVGHCRHYGELYEHLMVEKGQLLEGKGPTRLLNSWDLDDGIVVRSL